MRALALSGGGAKGAAHVGALLELDRMGIKFDMVVGTSIGALVGVGYAALGNVDLLYEYALNLQNTPLIKRAPSSKEIKPFIKCLGSSMLPASLPSFLYFWVLNKILKNLRFEDLPIQFACTAVNIENGELTVFTQGDILPAVKASMAMPGVFKPVKIDGKKYTDGGTLEILPIRTTKRLGADEIVGLKLLSKKRDYSEVKNSADAFDRIDGIRENILQTITESDANIIIELPTEKYKTLDFTQTQELIETGRKAVIDKKDEILEKLI